jgi:hypothetical protein
MQLFHASKQWSARPNDERFWGPSDALAACAEYKANAAQSRVTYRDLRVEARDGDMYLLGRENQPALLTHYAFGQLSARAKAPAEYLRQLPATLAAQNINHGLKERADDEQGKLLLHRNGALLARCVTGAGYERIWNAEIFERLVELGSQGWRTPPARPVRSDPRSRPATAEDVGWCGDTGLAVKIGDSIAPAGCYASDRDMFAFLVRPQNALRNPADPTVPLLRGFLIWNSEVGDRSFGIMTFLLDAVCGNHIIWGAQDVREFRCVHVGSAREKAFRELRVKAIEYANNAAGDDQLRIAKAQEFVLGDTRDDIIARVLGLASKRPALKVLKSNTIGAAYDLALKTPRYGNPSTAWAVAQGVTELSQTRAHASARLAMDEAAGELLTVAF